MFAHFKKDKNKISRSLSGCPIVGKNNFETPKFIIVYAGDSHIQGVSAFLEDMFENPIYESPLKHGKKIKLSEFNTDARGTKIPNTFDEFIEDFLEL